MVHCVHIGPRQTRRCNILSPSLCFISSNQQPENSKSMCVLTVSALPTVIII